MKQLEHKIVKAFYVTILVFCSCNINAQTVSSKFTSDNIFGQVEKSHSPSGFLGEYGAQLASQETYKGILADSNCINGMSWHYIYASIRCAKIYGINTLPTAESNCIVSNNEGILNMGANPVKVFALNYGKPDTVTSILLALYETPKTKAHTNHIDFCHCIRNSIFTITTLPPNLI